MRTVNYLENLDVIPLDYYPKSDGSKWWKVVYDIKVELSNGDWIVIPAGFETDLSSVPKFLWGLFPPFGRGLLAYLIHDFLYVNKLYSRAFCDKEMYKWAKVLRQQITDPWLRYIGVRGFGWLIWQNVLKL